MTDCTTSAITQRLRAGYDAIAASYAHALYDELAAKPLDRLLLDWLLARVKAGAQGPICAMGCGPGQVARYLHDHEATVRELDLSPAMIAQARQLNPDIVFDVGDILNLDAIADETFGGSAAFYCIVNLPAALHPLVFAEWRRVLRPGGTLLLSFHRGSERIHADELFGSTTDLDFFFFEPELLKGALRAAGFTISEVLTREPYPVVEHATELDDALSATEKQTRLLTSAILDDVFARLHNGTARS